MAALFDALGNAALRGLYDLRDIVALFIQRARDGHVELIFLFFFGAGLFTALLAMVAQYGVPWLRILE